MPNFYTVVVKMGTGQVAQATTWQKGRTSQRLRLMSL